MIQFLSEPLAGENFGFSVYPENANVYSHTILASINDQEIYRKTIECDDPPCHEMFFISREYSDKTLRILYKNNTGRQEVFSFLIQSRYLSR